MFCCVVATLLSAVDVNAQSETSPTPESNADLVGLWGHESISGPQVRGELLLRRGPDGWSVSAGGFDVAAQTVHDTLFAEFPGGQGEFRVRLPVSHKADLRGFWIQPQGPLGARYSSPFTLHSATNGRWRGTIEPLDERWSVYLLIQRQEDGSLRGYFRNPEMNWRGGASVFRVVRDGSTLRFLDVKSAKPLNGAVYDSAARQIVMDFGRQVVLTPRTRNQAVGFYPRTPRPVRYAYREPLPRAGDGWTPARAADVGLNEANLVAFVDTIEGVNPVGVNAPAIQSLLVARHGKLVLEEYFGGFDAMRPHELRSASKAFTSVMLGVAMRAGDAISPETPVYSMFAGTEPLVAKDPDRSRMTVGNLLTHSSGLACDDNDDASLGNEERLQTQSAQPDWYRYALELPLLHAPGTVYAYCSAGINLAAGMIARATKTWLPEFFDRTIAQPLQIDHYSVNLTPEGDMYGGGGVYMRPRDFLKFGQLYLDGGVWNGKRIVDKSWVTRSTAHQITNPNGSDGFAWHRFVLKADGREYQEYEASGNGGQYLMVIPELDLVVVITAANYNEYGIWRKFREAMVPRYVLSAVQR